VTSLPVVIDIVSVSIANSGTARGENIISIDSISVDAWPAAIHPAVARVVAIDEHSALPILVAPAIVKATITPAAIVKYIDPAALPDSPAPTLRER